MKSKIIINQSKSELNVFWRLLLLFFFTSVGVNAQHTTEFEFSDAPQATLRIMQNNVRAVFGSIHNSYFEGKGGGVTLSMNNATDKAISQIQALWSTSHFYCTETDVIQPVVKSSTGYQVRNIPVFFKAGKTNEGKYQDLVIEFAPDGKINDLYISFPNHQIEKFFEGALLVTDLRRRELIVGFMENFRTAYNRKDIPFLDKVFSNDALIIVGREVQASGRGDSPMPTRSTVEYVKRTKTEYLENLKKVFDKNEFIDIKFSEINVMRKSANSSIYGVTLRQDWESSTYSDVGWLFLMIDFSNEERPQIWVRTWQPISVPRREVFELGDFTITE